MRRLVVLSIICCLSAVSLAQTQQSMMKTRGKMVNGKLVPGIALTGAVVTLYGRTNVGVQNWIPQMLSGSLMPRPTTMSKNSITRLHLYPLFP